MKLFTPVILGKVQTLADGGIRAYHDYPELRPEDKTTLFGMSGKALNQGLATEDEPIPEVKEEAPKIKPKKVTKSQILRLAIEDLWSRRGEKGDSEDFYNQTMDKLTETIRERE